MKLYTVVADILGGLSDTLQEIGAFKLLLNKSYILKTDWSADKIYQHIRKKFNRDDDFLFVAEFNAKEANGWIGYSIIEFIKTYNEEQNEN